MSKEHENGPVCNSLSGTVHGSSVQAQTVHGGITFNVSAQPTPGSSRVLPDEIPPLTVPFVNRASDLALLDAACRASRSGIGLVSVYGMPGIGKTATVSRWAETKRESFPDGQIYINYADLRESGDVGDLSEVVWRCLISLGVDEASVPQTMSERIKLYRSLSGGRRLLVVLDNVTDPAQVMRLVPKGRGSVLLVTSAGQFGELAVDGARFVPLKPLDDDDALRLLVSRCRDKVAKADEQAITRLVDTCAGLPIALNLIAARLVTTHELSVAGLADELSTETTRLAGMTQGNRSLSAALSLTYCDLPAAESRMYRRLGYSPARTFDSATAAVVHDIDVADAVAQLEVLRQYGLLEECHDGRWRMHDLVRLHARECAADEESAYEQGALVQRIANHYLMLTVLADRAIRRDRLRIADLEEAAHQAPNPFAGDAGVSPLAWLKAEQDNILSVMRVAYDEGLCTHVWQIAEAFTVLFLHHRHLSAWKESLELGVAAASAEVVPAAKARLCSLLSRPLMDVGEFDTARAYLDTAIACAEISGRTLLRASVLEFDGRYWDRFDPARAMEAYRSSAALNAEGGEPRGEAIAIYFLGCAQDAHGEHAEALETLRGAHQMLTQVEDSRMAARATLAMGLVLDHLGEPVEAIRQLTVAADVLHTLNATHYEAQAHQELANIIERVGGSQERAQGHIDRALKIYEASGHPQAEVMRRRREELEVRRST